MNRLVCFLLEAVSFDHLVATTFLPRALDRIFGQYIAPQLLAQVSSETALNEK